MNLVSSRDLGLSDERPYFSVKIADFGTLKRTLDGNFVPRDQVTGCVNAPNAAARRIKGPAFNHLENCALYSAHFAVLELPLTPESQYTSNWLGHKLAPNLGPENQGKRISDWRRKHKP
jgi:hypothetical protein